MTRLINRIVVPCFSALLLCAGLAQADTLELRSGKSLSGNYAGGSSNNVRFRVDGSTQTFAVAEVDSLFFESADSSDAAPTKADTANSGGSDMLELKDGSSKQGSYAGGSSSSVRFNSGGTMYTYNVGTVDAVFFTAQSGGAQAAPAAVAPAPAAVPAPAPVLAAGSRIMIRLGQAIDSRKHKAGFRFTGRLESDLVANGVTIAPRGANVYGVLTSAKQSGRMAGKSKITLTLTDIMVNNQMRPVVTSSMQAVTDNTAGNSARKTLGAAAIGGLISGRSGAKTGAKVGLGASLLTKGESINIPAGTLLEFRLGQPFQG